MEDDGPLFMVVRQDTHGSRFLMKDGLTREEAERYLASVLDAQLKIHHQDYSIISYAREVRRERLADLGIIA